jgi:hypothetical protein
MILKKNRVAKAKFQPADKTWHDPHGDLHLQRPTTPTRPCERRRSTAVPFCFALRLITVRHYLILW